LPLGDISLEKITKDFDEEIIKIQEELISEKDYQKLQNMIETNFVNSNSSIEGIANSLAEYYAFYKDTNLINSEIKIYRSISREEIQQVAQKYLKPNQRLVLSYLPESSK
jgi:predicted Zn-dependent peptidase